MDRVTSYASKSTPRKSSTRGWWVYSSFRKGGWINMLFNLLTLSYFLLFGVYHACKHLILLTGLGLLCPPSYADAAGVKYPKVRSFSKTYPFAYAVRWRLQQLLFQGSEHRNIEIALHTWISLVRCYQLPMPLEGLFWLRAFIMPRANIRYITEFHSAMMPSPHKFLTEEDDKKISIMDFLLNLACLLRPSLPRFRQFAVGKALQTRTSRSSTKSPSTFGHLVWGLSHRNSQLA